jgi:hypothetical protein
MVDDATPASAPATFTTPELQLNIRRDHPCFDECDVREAAANLCKKDDKNADEGDAVFAQPATVAPLPFTSFDITTVDEESAVPYIYDVIDQCKYPKELARISQEQFEKEKAEWELLHEVSFTRGDAGTPKPPSNPEQRSLARIMLKKVRESKFLSRATGGAVDDGTSIIGALVIGAAGTGKSQSLKTIIDSIAHENLGTVLSVAHTGVATTQVNLLTLYRSQLLSFTCISSFLGSQATRYYMLVVWHSRIQYEDCTASNWNDFKRQS